MFRESELSNQVIDVAVCWAFMTGGRNAMKGAMRSSPNFDAERPPRRRGHQHHIV